MSELSGQSKQNLKLSFQAVPKSQCFGLLPINQKVTGLNPKENFGSCMCHAV